MSSRVYKLKFSKPSYQLNDDYDRLSDIEKEKISDMEADAFLIWMKMINILFLLLLNQWN